MVFLIILGIVAGVAAWAAYGLAFRVNLDRLSESGAIRVEQATERLVNQLESYRVQINLVARDPRIVSALSADTNITSINRRLRDHVLRYGADKIEIFDDKGKIVASSAPQSPTLSFAKEQLFTAALNGRLGMEHGMQNGTRIFAFSHGIIGDTAPPVGAIFMSVNIADLEFQWSLTPETIGFFDKNNVVFASNRKSLLLRHNDREGPELIDFKSFPNFAVDEAYGHRIWRFDNFPDLPAEALVIDQDAPVIGMTARGFIDIAPARVDARQQAALAASAVALLGFAIAVITLWRKRVADLLAVKTALNAKLEQRVEKRTSELKATQHQLIQASKMTALGEMSAGISHELNQPLAAISNFAENGVRFIDLDRAQEAQQNLTLISDQVGRINRIIRNLRAFARSEDEHREDVDLRDAANEAISLVQTSLDKGDVNINTSIPETPIIVSGGKVRLQQVIVNLLSNACDAMHETQSPAVSLKITHSADTTTLRVQDNGPGIEDPTRVFEPFYSTKELGSSKGLGLGLSISYGIIGSFGGDITATNAPSGGAIFEVTMPLAKTAGPV